MKSIFEQNGGTYTKVGDYYIPNLVLPKQEKVNETKHQQPEKKNKKKERNK